MNTKDIKKIIHKLRVYHNNIIVIVGDPADDNVRALVDNFSQALSQSNLRDVFVIALKDFNQIAVMDIPAMNKHGWFRREQIASLFSKISVEQVAGKDGSAEDEPECEKQEKIDTEGVGDV